MELAEKIQKLRKELGLTQEQFAERLFVSRTAVSKWETGRGTPSIESLQLIARLSGTTLDALLRAEEAITVAENENKERIGRFASVLDGILNVAAVMGLLLPLYKAESNGLFYAVPLYQFQGRFAVFYWILPLVMTICGVIQLAIRKSEWETHKYHLMLAGTAVNICAVLLLILSGQPYPAVLFFGLLLMKMAVMLMKQR